jgi:PhnB protein
MLTWGDSPAAAEAPADWAGKVYHATLRVGDFVITGGDQPIGRYVKPEGFSIVLGIDDPSEAQRIFDELAEHGRITMPLQETFWASRYGALVDRFGIAWEINCERAVAPA